MVWHRRAGKDLVAVNYTAVSCMQRVGLYWHVLPTYEQGRKIVWEGMTKDGKKFLSAFPGHDNPGNSDPHKPKGIVKRKRDDKMFLELINGSVYQVVGTDDIDKLMGANPIGVVMSEYSLHNPRAWDYIRPILAENGGWAMFVYTMRGRNHGYRLYEAAKKNPKWFCELLTVEDTFRPDGTRVVSDEDIEEERRSGMDEQLIQQEFYNNADAALSGAYYRKQLAQAYEDKRITKVPYEAGIYVDTYWDLGMNDTMCILFVQRFRNEIRVIDFYHNEGEGLEHYIEEMRKKPYVYGRHYAPHDIKVRELGTGKSRWETALKLGVRFEIVKKLQINEGIQAVRSIFSQMWIDDEKCSYLIEAVKEYTKKWDEENKCFMNKPDHNWASHPCDALRTLGLAYKSDTTGPDGERQSMTQGMRIPQKHMKAQEDYDMLNY